MLELDAALEIDGRLACYAINESLLISSIKFKL